MDTKRGALKYLSLTIRSCKLADLLQVHEHLTDLVAVGIIVVPVVVPVPVAVPVPVPAVAFRRMEKNTQPVHQSPYVRSQSDLLHNFQVDGLASDSFDGT